MTDGTGLSPTPINLVAATLAEAEDFDWDLSALVDWPNIAPAAPAPISTAAPRAGAYSAC